MKNVTLSVLAGIVALVGANASTQAAVLPGILGNATADLAYNVTTGNLSFAKDGDVRDIREIRVLSAGSFFNTANAANLGTFDLNEANEQDRINLSAAYADGYNLGNLLANVPVGYSPLTDLTVQYGVNGGGTLTNGTLLLTGVAVPEPTTLAAVLGLGGFGVLRRRRSA